LARNSIAFALRPAMRGETSEDTHMKDALPHTEGGSFSIYFAALMASVYSSERAS
jgi:hypothetical protein